MEYSAAEVLLQQQQQQQQQRGPKTFHSFSVFILDKPAIRLQQITHRFSSSFMDYIGL
jgi:hypothetical protein